MSASLDGQVGRRDQMETLHYEARGTFQAKPEALWPLLADTARLNRAIGLPPVKYAVTPVEGGGSRVEAEARMLGLSLGRYFEHPFHWEAPHGFVVVREFQSGPLRRIRVGTELSQQDSGTEVRVYGDFAPRNAIGLALVRLLGLRSVQRTLEQCRLFDLYLRGEASHPFPQLAGSGQLPELTTRGGEHLAQVGSDERAIELLRRHLAEGRDDEVVKMRPFELADRWGLERRATLALFLRATTAGQLVMSWDVLCPNCRIAKAEYGALRDLASQAHCETCNITFDAAFDRSVEVRFSVAPRLRKVLTQEFCIGGPMNTPHVAAQAGLEPGESTMLRPTLVPGTYRLRVRGSGYSMSLEARPQTESERAREGESGRNHDRGGESRSAVSRARATVAVTIGPDGVNPPAAEVAAGLLELEVRNATNREQVVLLEGSLWPSTVATAALVSTMQEFRDLFSSEVLAPGLELGIQNLAFMFTDLTGSTALYQAIGQARAFRLVQDHFLVLRNGISTNSGALVKTIGDAVMATFPSATDALAAALQIQRDIRTMEAPPGVDTTRLVKIGLHQGPCLAVNLNERLDYFGTTVNTASRIEHECRGGQIVASLAVCQSDEATSLLREWGATLEEEVVRLRGIDEPLPVYRIKPME